MFDFKKYISEVLKYKEFEDGLYAPSEEWESRICIENNSVSYSSGDGERLIVPELKSKEEADWFLYFTGFELKPKTIS